MGFTLRHADIEDLQAVKKIILSAYSPYIARIGRQPGPMQDDYEHLIAQGSVHVAVQDGEARALMVLIPERETMLLDNLAVAPPFQGIGLGRKLLQFAEHAASAAGYATIRLYANEALTENILIYARLGYVETHRATEKGFRRVYMTKRLS